MTEQYIFQIGFNKCGTRSLYYLFQKSGVPSIHYASGVLAKKMHRRLARGRSPIPTRWSNKQFFCDMEWIYGRKIIEIGNDFKKLDSFYPNAKFILNTRNRDKWIKSRLAHKNKNYVRVCMKNLGMTQQQVVNKWKNDWDKRHEDINAYFANRPGKLLVFNIEKDKPMNIQKFFNGKVLAKHWGVVGKTKGK